MSKLSKIAGGATGEHSSLRLTQITVKKLFGRLDHDIELAPEGITILHGANGSGKTTLLRAVSELSAGPPHYLLRLPFSSLSLEFEKGEMLQVIGDKETAKLAWYNKHGKQMHDPYVLPRLLHEVPGLRWMSDRGYDEDWVRSNVGILTKHYASDPATKKSFLASMLHQSLRHREGELDTAFKPPEWLTQFWARFSCTLIEEQRLIKMDYEGEHRSPRIKRVIEDFTAVIKDQFLKANSRYGERSQELDRSFPQRMVMAQSRPAKSINELRHKIHEVEQLRKQYQGAGLLSSDAPGQIELPEDADLRKDEVRRVLSLYFDDLQDKLNVLEDVYIRLQLTETLLGNYFSDKRVSLSREGVQIEVPSTGTRLTADMLSSGEQHILILFYRLLYGNLGKNHLVMIDEPELSLHARWQIRFVSDLLTIRKITGADFLLASHSPLIFQGHWDLARDLEA